MALRSGVSFLRLVSLRQSCRFERRISYLIPGSIKSYFEKVLSTHVRTEVQQNGGKMAEFPGAKAPYTSDLKFIDETNYDPIPIYRVMDNNGDIIDSKQDPNIDKDDLVTMYKTMIQLNEMDKILYESQRQGRISFYMTNYGEEGIHVGSASALQPQDLVFAQYREAGVLLYRGITVPEMLDQCLGNCDDAGRGRQMPVHYGSRLKNVVTISSPLATQMPQAVGAAYALKRQDTKDRCVICYFGEGAASEGDAHAALNFAATLDCPIIFFCRNNGYAISTPSREQYRGDGVAARGPALGVRTARLDGTDPLAVHRAVRDARLYAIEHNKPVLLEAMSYRVGHHSTSDDSTAYRSIEEIQKWTKDESPIHKFQMYLEKKGLWNAESESSERQASRSAVLRALQEAEVKPLPEWREMMHDVTHVPAPRLLKQMKELEDHLEKYKDKYPMDRFKSD